jgi:oxalate---CoA ligase
MQSHNPIRKLRYKSVMRGYRNNPEANAAAFIGGWFRTGDIGAIDNDGYLALTGRIKELINRGGEKVSPAEVEAVLIEYPAVAEAAVFGVADPKYGEHVSAAVVLRSAAATERQLQFFCQAHLADFKMPEVIHLVLAIPKKAMGKVQRLALAQRFKAFEALEAGR